MSSNQLGVTKICILIQFVSLQAESTSLERAYKWCRIYSLLPESLIGPLIDCNFLPTRGRHAEQGSNNYNGWKNICSRIQHPVVDNYSLPQ